MIKHSEGRIVIKANKEQKNNYTFSNGTVIRLERKYNNLDYSYTQQTLAEVVSAEGVPEGALILFHFNALHDTYKINNHSKLSGEEIAQGIELYSLKEEECYLWKMPGEKEWQPMKNYDIALRAFKPYTGIVPGIEPALIKDTLYVLTGELRGKVVRTLKACDPEIKFRNESGVDETIIRFRPFGNEKEKREPEAIAIDDAATKLVKNGNYLIGLTPTDAKPINESVPI